MRTVVVGASSGVGRCIGVGLAQRGANVALLARRLPRLQDAAKEAGPGTAAIECDVTDPGSVHSAIVEAAGALGGIDSLVYASAVGDLRPLVDTDQETWRRTFDTNVIGASLVTAAAVAHLETKAGNAVYLSSWSASITPPWPGLGAYAASKAALEKMVEAWRSEHPAVAFTRVVIGNCVGGEGDSRPQFADQWDTQLGERFMPEWVARKYLDAFVDVEELTSVVHSLLKTGSVAVPSLVVLPRSPLPG